MPANDTIDKLAKIVEGCELLDSRLDAMSRKDEPGFKAGDYVAWSYRGATGHGKITGVYKNGATAATTEYNIEEFDHHPGEKSTLHHYGSALRHTSESAAKSAAKKSRKDEDVRREPYGDVKYADPGYQADKQKRYPIDDAEHIRAAWNYIHKHRDEGKYTAPQLKRIESRIKEAWKKKIDPKGPPEARDK